MNPGDPSKRNSQRKVKQISGLVALNLLLVVLSPFILLKKLSRMIKKGSRHELDWHRWLIPSVQPAVSLEPKPGPRIVLFGPAFGELRLVEAITQALSDRRPDLNIVWCIGDLATIEFAKAAHPNQAIVISPYENLYPVAKWSRIVQPDLVVLVEKFWLPNLLAVSKLRKAKVAVVNARSNRKGNPLLAGYFRWIVQNVDLFCFQSPDQVDRLQRFYAPHTRLPVTGNMKLDLNSTPLDEEACRSLQDWLDRPGGVPLVAAGSTGSLVDEEFVLDAFAEVRRYLEVRLLLAPRRLSRVAEVAAAVEARGLKVSLRTRPSPDPTDVYLLDTLGELAYAYQFTKAAFIGDTVIGSGHNVIEPLQWGVPVSYGPSRGHFEDLQKLAESFGVGFRCSSSRDLAEHWRAVLTDRSFEESIGEKATRMIDSERGATDKTVAALLELIG